MSERSESESDERVRLTKDVRRGLSAIPADACSSAPNNPTDPCTDRN